MCNTTIRAFLATTVCLSLISTGAAATVDVVGTLENVDGVPLSGTITVIQQAPSLTFTHHEVDKGGLFKFTSDGQRELVLHVSAPHHPAAELVIAAGATGVVNVDFVLPLGQDVQVRVVDSDGNGVPAAALRVRYHEPRKPFRRVSLDHEEKLTDGDGRALLQDVGIQVPFVVDVLAPHYPPISSRLTTLAEGETKIEDIVLGKPGATVVVELVDKEDFPVSDAWITLLADPAGLTEAAQDSWLHSRAFRQRAVTSALGNVRFTGVPPGRIIVRVKTATDSIEGRGIAESNQELWLSLRTLQ